MNVFPPLKNVFPGSTVVPVTSFVVGRPLLVVSVIVLEYEAYGG